jgi:DNA invertase Pin-like site-specific DNA recombinase
MKTKSPLIRTDPCGAIYARISDMFNEKEDSLDNQVSHCDLFASDQNVPIPAEYVFRERDSGHETADTRKVLLKLRELIRSRRITHLFIHNFDRLSRTPEELVILWKEALEHGVKVICCMFPVFHVMEDVQMAKMLLRMVGQAAENEWYLIRARTTQNKQQIRNRGLVVGEGGPRFGFVWDRETRSRKADRTVRPEFGVSSAQIVETIYGLIDEQGYSLRKTARELNQRGWPTPSVYRGKKYKDGRRPVWTSDSVRLIVIDEQYKGVVTCSRTVMVGKRKARKKPREEWTVLKDARTEALISPELWEQANRKIRDGDIVGKRRRARAAETRNENNFALYRGLIVCGVCGKPLRPVWARRWNPETKKHDGGAGRDRIYRCDSRVQNWERGQEELCKGSAVYEWKVKRQVWEKVVEVATNESLILAEAQRLKRERPGEQLHRDSQELARRELEGCERRIRNLRLSLAETDDREERGEIQILIEQAKKARDGHQRHIDRLAQALSAFDEMDRRADEMIERCRQMKANHPQLLETPDEKQRELLEWLGVTLVGNGTRLVVRFDLGLSESIGGDLGVDEPVVVEEKPGPDGKPTFQRPRGDCRS